jgi:hypothetical protein
MYTGAPENSSSSAATAATRTGRVNNICQQGGHSIHLQGSCHVHRSTWKQQQQQQQQQGQEEL